MRIFFVTHTYSLKGGGGGEIFVAQLLGQLCQEHQFLVFAPAGRDFSEEENELGLQSCRYPVFGHHALHKFEQFLHVREAEKAARKFKPDVIWAQNDVLSGWIGAAVKRKTGKPLVCNVEYLSEKAVSWNMRLVFELNRNFLAKIPADAFSCWSRHVIEKFLLPWGIPKEKIAWLPAGLPGKRFAKKDFPPEYREKFGAKMLVSVKPLHSTNAAGLKIAVRAMPFVLKVHPDARYAVFGEGQAKKELVEEVEKLGLQEAVLFPGELTGEEVPGAYAAAAVVLHSFAFEATTSIALLESMAAGKAIVATDIGEVARTLGDAGELCKPFDPESMAGCILRILDDGIWKKELERRARLRFRAKFSIRKIAKRWNALLERVAGRREEGKGAGKN